MIAIVVVDDEDDEFELIELPGAQVQETDGELVVLGDDLVAKPEAYFRFHYSAGKTEIMSWGPQATVITIACVFMLVLVVALYLQR